MDKLPDQMGTAIEDLQSESKVRKAKAVWTVVCVVGALLVGFAVAYVTLKGSIEASVSSSHSAAMGNKDSQIALLQTQYDALVAENAKLAGSAKEEKDAAERLEFKVAELENRIAQQTEVATPGLDQENRDLKAESQALKKKLNESASERSSLLERIEAQAIELRIALSERDSLREDILRRDARISEAEAKVLELKAEVQELNGKLLSAGAGKDTESSQASGQSIDEIEARCAANDEFVEVVENVPLRTCSGDYVLLVDRVTSSAYISVNGAERTRIAPGTSHDYLGGKCKVSVTGLSRGTSNVATLYVNCN